MVSSLIAEGHEILFGWPPLFIVGEWLIVAALVLTAGQIVLASRAVIDRKPGAIWALAPGAAALLVASIAIHWEFTPTLFKL
jgi:drug/metabolite transporter (DMT)-like permease